MDNCGLCQRPAESLDCGVPTYLGDVVSNAFPEEMLARDGGILQVCRDCHRQHERGRVLTYDRHHLRVGPFGFRLVDGAGI